MPIAFKDPALKPTISFLKKIGLKVDVVPGATGFIKDILIHEGGLPVDPAARASGLLHEAGHLALIPAQFRHLAHKDLDDGPLLKKMHEACRQSPHPDSPLQRAVMQCGDTEATAWAWAAGMHLGFGPAVIIRSDEYDGTGSFIRDCLKNRSYLGINGLASARWCAVNQMSATYSGLPVYPALNRWLQPAISHFHDDDLRDRSSASRAMTLG